MLLVLLLLLALLDVRHFGLISPVTPQIIVWSVLPKSPPNGLPLVNTFLPGHQDQPTSTNSEHHTIAISSVSRTCFHCELSEFVLVHQQTPKEVRRTYDNCHNKCNRIRVKMNSYFNAGYHDWQQSELHHSHYASNRHCSSPSLAASSPQANFYAANNGYHSYIHHSNQSVQLNYANNSGYATLPSSPTSFRYPSLAHGDSTTTTAPNRSVFTNSTNSTLASFPNSNLHPHLYNDPIVFGNISSHYPVSTSELSYSELASQQATNQPIVTNESVVRNLSSDEKDVSENECSSGESNHVVFKSQVCGKLPNSFETTSPMDNSSASIQLVKDNSQQSHQAFDETSPPSTPDTINGNNGPPSALQSNNNNKAFFPWMKSYTGKYLMVQHCLYLSDNNLQICLYHHKLSIITDCLRRKSRE